MKNRYKKEHQTVDDSEAHLEGLPMEADEALSSPEEWSTVLTAAGANEDVSFQDFLNVDKAVNVCGALTDADINSEMANEGQKENESGDEEEAGNNVDAQPVASRKEARQAPDTLCKLLECTRTMCFGPLTRLRRLSSKMYQDNIYIYTSIFIKLTSAIIHTETFSKHTFNINDFPTPEKKKRREKKTPRKR